MGIILNMRMMISKYVGGKDVLAVVWKGFSSLDVIPYESLTLKASLMINNLISSHFKNKFLIPKCPNFLV